MRMLPLSFVLLCLSGVSRAEAPGYVDTIRVRSTATKPARADAEYQTGQPMRDKALNDAVSAAQAAKPADQTAAWAKARDVQVTNRAVAQKVDEDFAKGLVEVLNKLRADRHVAITAGPGIILSPGVDLTDEAIRRWDAADGQALAADNARLKAELAAAKAAKTDPPKK